MFGSAAAHATPPAAQNDRKFFRLQTNFPIDIVVPSVTVPVPATLGDISEGGARVVSKSTLLRGADIEFTLKREGQGAPQTPRYHRLDRFQIRKPRLPLWHQIPPLAPRR